MVRVNNNRFFFTVTRASFNISGIPIMHASIVKSLRSASIPHPPDLPADADAFTRPRRFIVTTPRTCRETTSTHIRNGFRDACRTLRSGYRSDDDVSRFRRASYNQRAAAIRKRTFDV